VKKGDVIMIIESMKLMNEIQSDFDGKVKEILVENGAAVEYDQPVMIIG
jgi:acetyl-CoA carboxylase biotin carboxyl carrier protein